VALSEAGSSLRCVAVSLDVRGQRAGGCAAYSLWLGTACECIVSNQFGARVCVVGSYLCCCGVSNVGFVEMLALTQANFEIVCESGPCLVLPLSVSAVVKIRPLEHRTSSVVSISLSITDTKPQTTCCQLRAKVAESNHFSNNATGCGPSHDHRP